ncbi:ABC transporter permease, partial [Xanthomonas citri pv. citri]|nr:ABC transporter permease [Xanthomonas citri pv. citri]
PSPTPSVTPTPSLSPEPRPTSSITPPKTSVAPKPTPAQSQKRSLPREQTRKPVLKPKANKTPCTQRLVLDHGHSDVFRVGSAAKNGLDLKVKEDVTGEGVLHAPESVLLAV